MKLANRSSIKDLFTLRESLVAAHGEAAVVAIDASEVETIDMAVLQMLVAFNNSLKKQDKAIQWQNPSDVFQDMAKLADLHQVLDIDSAIFTETVAPEDVDGGAVEDVDDGLCPVF